ncbi:acetolactate synthase large subunit [Lederbergia wuyishanensis]|uniref:Acetolactate synthase-1/2/3 large subunit n=1 Tax=Lederbergia wuyishanensis TaxID=1347903 RepID=A0ABU0D3W9_9BACI|nr:acetolactate synthase large subunit [Lederbergia wuyishanensis]MCJ8007774.1 acetolactate synthase large subunit [Lederbergia wuyishanensis]MDQ0343063.1 acetolactate synthase-1/2/3 large subunit [Lederbergia wuyishanensis]
MKATDVIVQCLENEGVEYIFGIVGKETLDFIESLSKSSQITFIPVRHEQGAAIMASAYGKFSGKTGVCTSTLGPGATNLCTGIASAFLDYSPVVAITGQAGLDKQHDSYHQLVDIVKIFEPITKCASQVLSNQAIPEMIRIAFRTSQTEKPGPALLVIPENLAMEDAPPKGLPVLPEPSTKPDFEDVTKACKLINESQKPLIIVGNGVLRQKCIEEFYAFADNLQVPVTHSFTAKGILPKNSPLNYYTFGFEENDLILSGIDEADLLIVIGFDIVEKLPKDWNRKKAPILHINANNAPVDEYYPVQAELIGNIQQTLKEMNTQQIHSKSWTPSGNLKKRIEQIYHISHSHKETANLPLTTENILKVIEKVSTDHTILISDVGAHKISVARTYQPKQAGGVLISNGFASMGIAMPSSIGAKLALPNNTIICITGDGGALMNFAEIETAKRLGLSFIMIVLNDYILELEKQMMKKKFGDSFGVNFGNPDFVQLARSFGIKGVRPNTLDEFEELLISALSSDELILFEIPLLQRP